jgi:enamine deaminase RidA (YjgF/YER057c/UK114 family)
MPVIKIFNPAELSKPRSPYMQVARVKTSEFAFIAGQVSVDASGALIGAGDFDAQCAQVFANIHAALRSVGAEWRNVVEFHVLPRSFSRRARLRRLSPSRIPDHVLWRRLSTEYFIGDRAPRERILLAGNPDRRRALRSDCAVLCPATRYRRGSLQQPQFAASILVRTPAE